MAIERFQAFALYRDRRKFTRTFSMAWFLSSWVLAFCFLVILLSQIVENKSTVKSEDKRKNDEIITALNNGDIDSHLHHSNNYYVSLSDMDLFPGPNSDPGTVIQNLNFCWKIQIPKKLFE